MWFTTWGSVTPALACVIIHVLIFIHVRNSSRRVQTEAFSVQRSLASTRRRDWKILQQAVVVFCTFLLGCTPILLLEAIDDKRLVNPAIYASLMPVGSLSTLISLTYLMLFNNELKDYRNEKICFCLRLQTSAQPQ